jgi:hypothetical protein
MGPGERIVNDVGVGRGIPELLVAQGLVRSPKNTGEKAGGRLIVRNSKLRIAVGFGVAAGGLVSENFAVIANAQGIQKRRRDNPVPGSASVIPGPDGLASGGERSGKKRAAAAWVGGIQKDEAQMVIGAEVLIAFNNVVIEVIGAGSGKKVSVVYQRLRGGLRKHAEDLSGSGSNSTVRNDVSGEGIPALLSVDGLSGPGIEDLSGRNARPGAGIDGSCYRRGEIAREIAITKRVVGQRDDVGGRRAITTSVAPCARSASSNRAYESPRSSPLVRTSPCDPFPAAMRTPSLAHRASGRCTSITNPARRRAATPPGVSARSSC